MYTPTMNPKLRAFVTSSTSPDDAKQSAAVVLSHLKTRKADLTPHQIERYKEESKGFS